MIQIEAAEDAIITLNLNEAKANEVVRKSTEVAQTDSTIDVNPTLKSLGLGDDVVIPQLDLAQVELLEVKIEEVSVESLFAPVPLVSRLIEGGITDI